MSVSIQTVEFERREAHLSELEDGPPFTVHGVALGDDDVTVGQSGIKKLWPAEELEKAADSLEGRNLVVDHNNDSGGVVGRVTKAGYKDGTGVIYEAELFDEDLAEKINNELLEVSIRGRHVDVEEMEENEEGAKVVQDITFANLSIVPTGAAPSNTLEMGETEELSVAELSAFTEDLEAAELQEIEPGMWVRGSDMRGVTISAVDDGEIEVDVYEESDGKWRSTGETQMVSVDSLDEWDVDEEEDIGPMQDDEEESDDEEEENAPPSKFVFESEDEARAFIEDKDGLTGVHEMDNGWMPGDSHEEFEEWHEAEHESEDNEAHGDEESDDDEEKAVSGVPDNLVFNSEDMAMEIVEEEDGLTGVHQMDGQWIPGDSHDEFTAWFNEQQTGDELTHPEGSEKPIDSDADKKESRESQPERYPDDVDELQDLATHSVDFSGTTDSSWDEPAMEDFETDDLEEIDDHFLVSKTGFPPENFTDLALPVVEPSGELNLNALQNAKARAGQVDGVSEEDEEQLNEMINSLANDNFDDASFGEDEEEAARRERPRTVDDTGEEPGVDDTGPVDIALELINKYLTVEGTHERDSVDKMLSWLMGSVDLPMETLGDFRTAARRFLDETPGTDSFSGMTIEQFRDWLLMHGKESQGRREQDERDRMPRGEPSSVNVLTGDDLRHTSGKSGESELDDITTKVTNMTEEDIEQKLAELSEPVAVEQSDLEELQGKADRFEEMSSTLESLKERTDILDSVDRDQVEELADSEEPVVVESARMEELEGEAEQVKTVYAAALSDEIEAFDAEELADRFSIDELRSKYEDQIGDPAEELATSEDAEPQSGDVEEEELEERAEEEGSEEELESSETDEAEAKRDELRNKILG